VNLLPSDEQLEIISAAAEFLSQRMPVESIRADRRDDAAVPSGV